MVEFNKMFSFHCPLIHFAMSAPWTGRISETVLFLGIHGATKASSGLFGGIDSVCQFLTRCLTVGNDILGPPPFSAHLSHNLGYNVRLT